MVKDFQSEYARLGHAIQTGVMYELEYDQRSGTPKHLRTGVNMVLVQVGALVRVLVAKGLITLEEYEQELLAGLEAEKKAYEERLSEKYGGKITLG